MNKPEQMAAVFDEHVRDEFELKDLDATMKTMTENPYVVHLPTLTGGVGSLLAQIGLLDPDKLPVVGAEVAERPRRLARS